MSQSEIDEVLKNHEKETQEALRRLDQGRDKQAETLRQRLAGRRRQKQAELRKKHSTEVSNTIHAVVTVVFIRCLVSENVSKI